VVGVGEALDGVDGGDLGMAITGPMPGTVRKRWTRSS